VNTVVLLPDGIGVRNFVLGPLVNLLEELGEVTVLHGIGDDLVDSLGRQVSPQVCWQAMVPFREPIPVRVLRTTLGYSQMWWADTRAMRFLRQRQIPGTWRSRVLHQVGRACGRLLATASGIRLLNHLQCHSARRCPEVDHYRELFERLEPSVLFCSHQRPLHVLPPVLAALDLGIPTATFIFSWDNLTSKGRIAAPFEHFLVWSKLMREELLQYYPDVPEQRVHVVGTPQFDAYADRELLWPRDELLGRLGLDPERPMICYSGGDTRTCPEDPQHLQILLELIASGEIRGRPQVVLRPTPVDEGSRYRPVREAFPELVVAQPQWVHSETGDWSNVIPLPEDVQLLANLTAHADINVNMASTMTLDFAIHDTPVVNIAFDVADPPPFGTPIWEFFYRFEHYRPVVELGAARFARSRDELAEQINAYLADPSLDRQARRALVELEVGTPIGSASQRIVQTLGRIGS
jgi:hypothetical protein